MPKFMKSYLACAAIAGVFVPTIASALTVDCDVTVNYINSAGTTETYQKNFTVGLGPRVDFFEDFSTPTRQKQFSASISRVDTKPVVFIEYFSDVGTFTAIDLEGSLLIRGGTKTKSTSGRHQFIDSRLTPQTHTTDYTLDCARVIEAP